jgi:hypothetical protein
MTCDAVRVTWELLEALEAAPKTRECDALFPFLRTP